MSPIKILQSDSTLRTVQTPLLREDTIHWLQLPYSAASGSQLIQENIQIAVEYYIIFAEASCYGY